MKKHAIIPIFIPHLGCPHTCVFCNQNSITAKDSAPKASDIDNIADTWLSTLSEVDTVELAFYGGSFTAIPMSLQSEYLKIAKAYKDSGKIDKIHLSTRPDYINKEILDNLKYYGVDTIELGVQSFDENVLKLSERGHNAACVFESSALIKSYGFELGIQLMIGLPGDSLKTCIYSAKEAVKCKPDIARLYPTVVVKNTKLYDMSLAKLYTPLSEEEAVFRTKEMYKILDSAGINIIRVGLKSSDLIAGGKEIGAGSFHPAFRQLVESEIAKEKIDNELEQLKFSAKNNEFDKLKVDILSNSHSFSAMIGNKRANKEYFAEIYKNLNIAYKVDNNLLNGEYKIICKPDISKKTKGVYKMERSKRAVITIVGNDRTGILAAAATEVAKVDGNIINVTQNAVDGIFTMAMIIDINKMTVNVDELQTLISNAVSDMKVHVMHEDIFNAMHTI